MMLHQQARRFVGVDRSLQIGLRPRVAAPVPVYGQVSRGAGADHRQRDPFDGLARL
jgi:hypothetical protein